MEGCFLLGKSKSRNTRKKDWELIFQIVLQNKEILLYNKYQHRSMYYYSLYYNKKQTEKR